MRDAELVETFGPFVEIVSTIDEKLQVVEAGVRLVERVSRVRAVADETEDEAGRRIMRHEVSELPLIRRGVGPLLQPEQFAVAGAATPGIANCQVHFDTTSD